MHWLVTHFSQRTSLSYLKYPPLSRGIQQTPPRLELTGIHLSSELMHVGSFPSITSHKLFSWSVTTDSPLTSDIHSSHQIMFNQGKEKVFITWQAVMRTLLLLLSTDFFLHHLISSCSAFLWPHLVIASLALCMRRSILCVLPYVWLCLWCSLGCCVLSSCWNVET